MTPEQERLLNKAAKTLEAAKALNDRAFLDSAASRTYYVMFYIATAFLEGEKLSFSRHSAIIAAFGKNFARPQRVPVEFHRYPIDAQKIRLDADYTTEIELSSKDVQELIERAEEMLEFAVNNIDSLPPLSL